jgi:tRNA(adenine34) deaminase
MGITEQDTAWMHLALEQASKAQSQGEVPVGAIIVQNNQIVGRGYNTPITSCDPTCHAEINAIRNAAQNINNYRIGESTLYVTLEPCAMCAGAIIQARISRVVYGAKDLRAGAVETLFNVLSHPELNHRVETQGGCLSDDSAQLLRAFFKSRRV